MAKAKPKPDKPKAETFLERRSRGRPMVWTQDIEDEIFFRLVEGETLMQICRDEHMPCRTVVWSWRETVPGFDERYLRAREGFAEAHLDESFDIADDGSNDWMERELRDGRIITVPDHEHISRSKLRVEHRRWYAERAAARTWGVGAGKKSDDDDDGTIRVSILGGLPDA
jgi:hypothetical protein